MVLDVVRALGRRWYVVAVGLLLTSGIVYGAVAATPPAYNARGLVLLLPSDSAVGKGGNPFLTLAGLEQPAGILVAYFSSAPARAEVEAISSTAEYTVGIDDSTRGPVIAVDVTDSDPESTLGILDHLLTRIPEELLVLQEQVDAPRSAVIGSMNLTVDDKADVDASGMVRMAIAALVLGLAATGFAAYGIDANLERRRLRKAGASASPPSRTVRKEAGWAEDWEATLSPDEPAPGVARRGPRRHRA